VVTKEFRHDLYFRLAYFPLQVPPLRERSRDWLLIGQHFLRLLAQRHGVERQFSPSSIALLDQFTWPGNIRQLEAVSTIGYSLADTCLIEPHDFSHALGHEEFQEDAPAAALEEAGVPPRQEEAVGPAYDALYKRVLSPEGGFWNAIRTPFLERELNREQVRAIVERGLSECGGNYTELLRLFHIKDDQYGKFMGFLRTHDLKIGVRGRRAGEQAGF
jgi:DNA-binding NtrC family response regulator